MNELSISDLLIQRIEAEGGGQATPTNDELSNLGPQGEQGKTDPPVSLAQSPETQEAQLAQKEENLKAHYDRLNEIEAEQGDIELERESDKSEMRQALQQSAFDFKERLTEKELDLESAASAVKSEAAQKAITAIAGEQGAREAALHADRIATMAQISFNMHKELSQIGTNPFNNAQPASGIVKAIQFAQVFARAASSLKQVAGVQFDKGGNLAFDGGHIPAGGGMISGRSHGEGGVKFMMGNRIGEADGRQGEAYIVNTGNNPQLRGLASALNVAGGGRSFDRGGVVRFADGGAVSRGTSEVVRAQFDLREDLAGVLRDMPNPVVAVEDINLGQSRVARVQTRATI